MTGYELVNLLEDKPRTKQKLEEVQRKNLSTERCLSNADTYTNMKKVNQNAFFRS